MAEGVLVTITVDNAQGGSLSSSLLGGNDYEYVGSGIGTDKSIIAEVCGYSCARDAGKEQDNKLVCSVPPVVSLYALQ